jgi:hypothetical protein
LALPYCDEWFFDIGESHFVLFEGIFAEDSTAGRGFCVRGGVFGNSAPNLQLN